MPQKPPLEITHLPLEKLKPMQENPNEQDDETFNLLVESIREHGMIDPVDVAPNEDGTYDIIGGEHRFRACELLGHETLPAIVHDSYDTDKRKMMLVKLNVLRGKISPQKFIKLYQQMAGKYQDDVLQKMMGFAQKEAFDHLLKQVKENLPKEVARKVEDRKEEIQTVDSLAAILNRLFRDYGNTLDYSFMVFEFGGREHFWVRMDDKLFKRIKALADQCVEDETDFNDAIHQRLM